MKDQDNKKKAIRIRVNTGNEYWTMWASGGIILLGGIVWYFWPVISKLLHGSG